MDDDILKEFLAESWEKLIPLDQELISLAHNRTSSESLAKLSQAIHTIKGNCGFLGLESTGKLAHAVEQVLSKMHQGELAVSAKANAVILEAFDGIKATLQTLEATGKEPGRDDSNLLHELNSLLGPDKQEASLYVVEVEEYVGEVEEQSNEEIVEEILLDNSVTEEDEQTPEVVVEETGVEEEKPPVVIPSEMEDNRLLLFDPGDGSRMVVPMSLVTSYEQFSRTEIQRRGDQEIVPYQNSPLLILFSLESPNEKAACHAPQPVLVFSSGDQSLGIKVKEIREVVSGNFDLHVKSERPGILGTTLINNQVTDILDVDYYLSSMIEERTVTLGADSDKPRILIVEDSLFFRKLITKTLEAEGYHVSQSCSLLEAVERLEQQEQFDLIVTDLEMPGMSGIEFVEWFRQTKEDDTTPLIALSSNPEFVQPEKTGFDLVLKKFNSQQFLDGVEQLGVGQLLQPNSQATREVSVS